MTYDPKIPFNALPLLPPKIELETHTVLKKTISAGRALAEFNGALTNLPNPTLFVDTVHLQEAKASSEIENIVTTNDELYASLVAEMQATYSSAKEVLHYKKALWYGISEIERRPLITTNLCIKLVQIIKENDAGIRKNPGTQLSTRGGKVIYTPPVGEDRIRTLMQNLEEFIHADDDLDPLIKLAVMHYQFEAIHPFSDGNGRTGRILLLLYLKMSGLLDRPALFLSKYILLQKQKYYQNLRLVTEDQNWEPWILYILDVIEQSANENRRKVEQIQSVMGDFGGRVKEALPKMYSKELIECLFRMPYVKRKNLEAAGIGNYKTAGTYLKTLESHGFLSSIMHGKERLFLNAELMALLD